MDCDDGDNGCIENDFCSRCLILKEKKMLNNFEEIPAWVNSWVNCDSFGSELDKDEENEYDEAREKFEGMAEYTE